MEGCQGGKKEDSALQSIKIELGSLVCEGSYDDLEISLSKVQGIVDVDIDRKVKAAFIDYDSNKLSQKDIINKIAEVGCKIQEF